MRTETLHIYKYEELNDCAKANARAWFRNSDDDNYWAECAIDDAKEVAALMGWEIDKVYYSGFWSQGDGACFKGTLGYHANCANLVRAYAPQDGELNRIASAWEKLQQWNENLLVVEVKHRGHYYHEMCTEFEFNSGSSMEETKAKPIARSFMRWIYKRLEEAYEYSVSDEAVEETILANEYEFTVDGKIY